MARLMSLSYGSFTSDSTKYQLDGPVSIHKSKTGFEVSTRIVVAGTDITTTALLKTYCDALEGYFVLPRKDLTLVLDSQNRVYLREGYEAYALEPSITAEGTIPGDTLRSVVYKVTVRGKLPEPTTSRVGLSELEWTATLDAACKGTLRIVGMFTRDPASPSAGSRAAYTAGIGARVTAITGTLGGTWVAGPASTTTDVQDNETRFDLIYQERISYLTVLSDTNLKDIRLEVTRRLEAPGDAGTDVKRLQRLQGLFSCAVCKSGNTTLAQAAVAGTAALLAAATTRAGSAVAVTSLTPVYDDEGSRVTVTMEALASGGGTIIERKVTTQDELASNANILPTWTKTGDAQKYDAGTAFVQRSPVSILRTLTIDEVTLGDATPPGPAVPRNGPGGNDLGGFHFGFGQVIKNGFDFVPFKAGAGGSAADPISSLQAGKPTWVWLRGIPAWDDPLVTGLSGYGTPLRITRRRQQDTWQLVVPEPQGGPRVQTGSPPGGGVGSTRVRGSA